MRRCGYVRSDTEGRNCSAYGEADVILAVGARMEELVATAAVAVVVLGKRDKREWAEG